MKVTTPDFWLLARLYSGKELMCKTDGELTDHSETGITLPKNRIRHTAASFMAESQGYTETVNRLGHDIGMLLELYRRVITEMGCQEFYSICSDTVRV